MTDPVTDALRSLAPQRELCNCRMAYLDTHGAGCGPAMIATTEILAKHVLLFRASGVAGEVPARGATDTTPFPTPKVEGQ